MSEDMTFQCSSICLIHCSCYILACSLVIVAILSQSIVVRKEHLVQLHLPL